MNVANTGHHSQSTSYLQSTACKTGARLSSVLLSRASLAAARRSDRPGCEIVFWLLLGAGCVLWPLIQTYQQTSAFVAGSGLERLAVAAVCQGAEVPPCALASADTATRHGQAMTGPVANEATRREQTATIWSAGCPFPAAAWGASAFSGASLR